MNNTSNRELKVLELWPDNGTIMIEFNDYNFGLGVHSYDTYSTVHNYIIVDTIHEDNLEWEKEYVSAELKLFENEKEYKIQVEQNKNMFKVFDDTVRLKNTTRIGITDSFNIVSTEDGGDYLSINKNQYSELKLTILVSKDKMYVAFLGCLLD